MLLAARSKVADHVQIAACFSVERGDFVGTGRNAFVDHNSFPVDGAWSVSPVG